MFITVVTAMFTITQTEAEVGAQVATLGWSQESGVVSIESPFHVPYSSCNEKIFQVTPKNERGKNAAVPPTEDQLNRLTDFIAFLEN